MKDSEGSNSKTKDTIDGKVFGTRIGVFWRDNKESYPRTVTNQHKDHDSSAFLLIVHYGK